jgi:hypothetical protein
MHERDSSESFRYAAFLHGCDAATLLIPEFPRALCESPPLQQQTANQTSFLAAAANAAHRVFTGAAVAIGALHDASAERMRLGLEHLRRVRKPKAPPAPPTYEEQLADLIDAYADPTLHPDIERIARAMTRWAYKDGYCYATQEKIAKWTGLTVQTLQLRLYEMERRKLIMVKRRPGTSSITLFADTTLDALRLKKINKIKVRERTAPYVTRTFSAPEPKNTDEIEVSARQKIDSWSKTTTWSPQSISSTKPDNRSRSVVSTTSSKTSSISRARISKQANKAPLAKSEKIQVKSRENVQKSLISNETKPHEKPEIKSHQAEHASVQNDTEKQKEPAAISRKAEHTTPQNGKEERKKAVTPSVSSHPEHTAAASLLIAEGVTPARARSFAQLFEREHIERTIAIGMHRTKNNPPGYLLRLIQDDAASKRIVPGSEADRVRQRERPAALRGQIGPAKALEAREPVPSVVSPVQPKQCASEAICGTFSGASEPPGGVEDPLEALSHEDRDRYTQRAREEVLRANAWLGGAAHESNPIMQAMIRKQLRAMLATTGAPASRGAPSG